jgi:hypothetical protein
MTTSRNPKIMRWCLPVAFWSQVIIRAIYPSLSAGVNQSKPCPVLALGGVINIP